MACLLIDFENEGGKALDGISFLGFSEEDEIVLFYSRHADKMTVEVHKELEALSAKKTYIKVETAFANSLDFQLSTYLGARIEKNPYGKYYIVSKDGGYESVCIFWRGRSVFVKRIDRISHYTFASALAGRIGI